MFARFDLLIEKNSNNDTLTLDLNQAKVCLTDGREVLAGTVVRSDRDISECFLVIIGNKFYFKQGDLVSNTIDFDFRYPKGFDIEHFRPSIIVDWIGFRTNNKQFLPTRKIEGFVQQ